MGSTSQQKKTEFWKDPIKEALAEQAQYEAFNESESDSQEDSSTLDEQFTLQDMLTEMSNSPQNERVPVAPQVVIPILRQI